MKRSNFFLVSKLSKALKICSFRMRSYIKLQTCATKIRILVTLSKFHEKIPSHSGDSIPPYYG